MKIGAQIEEISGCDLPRHHRGGGSAFFCRSDQVAELAHPHPVNLVDETGECRIGLSLEGGGLDPGDACLAGTLRRKAWVGSVPCDQKECLWLLHDPEG